VFHATHEGGEGKAPSFAFALGAALAAALTVSWSLCCRWLSRQVAVRLYDKVWKEGLDREDAQLLHSMLGDLVCFDLHWGMFLPHLASQGDEEQQMEWVPVRSWAACAAWAGDGGDASDRTSLCGAVSVFLIVRPLSSRSMSRRKRCNSKSLAHVREGVGGAMGWVIHCIWPHRTAFCIR